MMNTGNWHRFFSDREQNFWRFWCQTRIFFGMEVTTKIRDVLFLLGQKVGLVCDENVKKLDFVKNIGKKIDNMIVAEGFIGLESDYEDIRRTASIFRKRGVDVIVAIGGGSVLDGAKVVSAIVKNEVDPLQLKNLDSLENDPVPLVCIPTTFGTGSEVNMYAHVNDRKSKLKIGLKKDFLTPTVAFVDPIVALETPAKIRYYSGIDAFVHNLEVLTLKREKSLIQETLSKYAIEISLDSFRNYIELPSLENITYMALVSLIGGIGIHNSRTGLIHTMAIPFAKKESLPHSESIIPFIIEVIKFNWMEISKYFCYSLEEFLSFVKTKILFYSVPKYKVVLKDINSMAEECLKDIVIFKENPVEINKETIIKLYEKSVLAQPETACVVH